MTVYKYFLKVALNYKLAIIGYVLLFFFITLIQSTSQNPTEAAFEELRQNVGLVDHSQSDLSFALTEYLAQRHNLVNTPNDEKLIREQIFLQAVDLVLVIPADFEQRILNKEKALELFRDDRKIGLYQVENQINKFISFVKATQFGATYDLEAVRDAFKEQTEVQFLSSDHTEVSREAQSRLTVYFNFAGYVIMAIYITTIGLVMGRFNDSKLESRRKVSGKKQLSFSLELYLGQLTIALVITTVFLLGSILIQGQASKDVFWAKYALNTLVYSLTALCLAYMINNISHKTFVISALGTILPLGSAFISGIMVPQALLGQKVLALARFFPVYYFVKANEQKANSLGEIKFELLMQLFFAGIFLLIGTYFFRKKRHQN